MTEPGPLFSGVPDKADVEDTTGYLRLAIVGSTKLKGNTEAEAIIKRIIDHYWSLTNGRLVVGSGGAEGIDKMAAAYFRSMGCKPKEFLPTTNRWKGPGGFQQRNWHIAVWCQRLVRIVSTQTRTYGSGWTRDKAQEMGKPTEEYLIDEKD